MTPSLILRHANILTTPPAWASADALIARAGRIVAVGRWADIQHAAPPDAPVLDLNGATVVPGLIDTHVHMASTGFVASSLSLHSAVSIDDVLERVRGEAHRLPPGQLIYGMGLTESNLREARYPTRQELDSVAPHHPTGLVQIGAHTSVVNSLVFARLNFPADISGVDRDPDGEPTGLLSATANGWWREQRWPEIVAGMGGLEAALTRASHQAVRAGLTTIHALDNVDTITTLLQIQSALPVRVVPYPQTRSVAVARSLGLPRIGGCGHCCLDGDFGPHTAALLEPYADDPTSRGQLYFADDELAALVREAQAEGMQVCVHTLGDRAVAQGLSAYAESGVVRHRLEHFEIFNATLARRAAELGVMVSVQPAFNHYWPADHYRALLGEARLPLVDPLADLIRCGVLVAGGSDSPVTPLAPLLGIHSAVNHAHAAQRVSPEMALTLFTLNAACLAFEEGDKGSIEVGKLCDLTVLAADPTRVAPEAIKDIAVRMTIVGGEVVYAVEGMYTMSNIPDSQ